MRRAFRRCALAAAIAAISVPFIAHAAAGEEPPPTPTAQVFPTRTGMGITWTDIDASAYRVERKQGSADWQNASGELASTATSWIDSSLTAGTTADYRVVAAHSGDEITTSPSVTATRAAQDPAVGDVDVLVLDADPGDGATWLRNEIAGPVTASAPVDGYRTLSAGTLKLRMPAFLAGPGKYMLQQSQFQLTQGDRSCVTSGPLTVSALTYTPDLQLETMAASFDGWSCAGVESGLTVEIRVRSAEQYRALAVSPSELPAVRVPSGQTSVLPAVTVKNLGTEPVEIEKVEIRSGAAWAWKIAENDCPAVLPVAATCSVRISFAPDFTAVSRAKLLITDSTSRGWHAVLASGNGTSLPPVYGVGVTSTFTGHFIRWTALATSGGTPVRGYWLHRFVNGLETTQWYDGVGKSGEFTVVDTDPPAGIRYALSVVNEVGEGPTGTPQSPPTPGEQLVVVLDGDRQIGRHLAGADLTGRVVPFPADANPARPEAVASSPDGRSVAYVSAEPDHTLRVRRVAPGDVGTSVALWSSPAPVTHLSWSPDGTRIAFETRESTDQSARRCVFVITASGGTPEKIECGLGSPSWVPTDQSLVVIDERPAGAAQLARIVARPGGAVIRRFDTPVTAGAPLRASPQGNVVAVGSGNAVRGVNLDQGVEVESRPLSATVTALSFSPDGRRLLVLTADSQLATLNPIALSGDTAKTILSGQRVVDVAWQGLNVVIPALPAVMGTGASVPFDRSALPPGAVVSCRLPTGETRSPCTSPVGVPYGLASGVHTVVVEVTEPGGRQALATRAFTLDLSGPVAQVVAPPAVGTSPTATVKYSATDSAGVASYDVRYRKASYLSGFGAYLQPWTATTATAVNLTLDPGYEYCVSVRAKDKLGNLGAWSSEKCFSRPLDDRAMGAPTAGWSRTSWSEFYLGTATQTTAYGASLTRTVQGKRFFLVATKCPTCGLVAVYAGGKYIGAVNLASATTQRQALVALPVQSAVFSGTLTFTVRSATGKFVQIDGLAVRRS